MSMGYDMMLANFDYDTVMDEEPRPQPRVRYWKQKGGKLIKISDMTDIHLQRTIEMLKRQVDGSAHDDFCWDNISAMEEELERRNKHMIQNVDLKVVGVTFTNEDGSSRKEQILTLAEQYKDNLGGIKIDLVREQENRYDTNAIKVLANDKQIGYLGKEYAAIIAPLMDEYEEFTAVVKGIGEYKNRPFCEITINQVG